MIRTLFFTVAAGRYQVFVVPYLVGVMHHNDDAAVEIVVDDQEKFWSEHKRPMDIVLDHFGAERVKIREEKFKSAPKARFLLEPEMMSEYVYIGDSDILVLETGITDWHLDQMRISGVPYSNIQRPRRERLTGLHFTRRDARYPLIRLDEELERKLPDEAILYEQVKRAGHLPAPKLRRPIHGIHMSFKRQAVVRRPKKPDGKPSWGVTQDKWEAYKKFVEADIWKAVHPHFADDYLELLSRLEVACTAEFDR